MPLSSFYHHRHYGYNLIDDFAQTDFQSTVNYLYYQNVPRLAISLLSAFWLLLIFSDVLLNGLYYSAWSSYGIIPFYVGDFV